MALDTALPATTEANLATAFASIRANIDALVSNDFTPTTVASAASCGSATDRFSLIITGSTDIDTYTLGGVLSYAYIKDGVTFTSAGNVTNGPVTIEGDSMAIIIEDPDTSTEVLVYGIPNMMGGFRPRYWREMRWQVNSGSNSMGNYGTATTESSSGTQTNVSDADGEWINSNTSSSGVDIGWRANAYNDSNLRRPLVFFARIKMGSSIANLRRFVGLTAADPMASDTPSNFLGFRYSTNASDTTWQLYGHDGSGSHVTDSGVTVAADGVYDLKFEHDPAEDRDRFWINGELVGNITGTGVYSTTGTDKTVGWSCEGRNLAAETKDTLQGTVMMLEM